MKKIIIGSLLAALALFFWGFIYYGISGIPYQFLGQSEEIGPLLKESFPADGTYLFPDPAAENAEELHKRGPIAMVHIKRDGNPNPMSMMGTGFLHGWVYCILLALLLKQICKSSGYGARVGFVALVATTGAFAARIGDAVWWQQSMSWQLSNLIYTIIGGAIIGSILAKFIPAQKS